MNSATHPRLNRAFTGLQRVEGGDWRRRLASLIAKHCVRKVRDDNRTTSNRTQQTAFHCVMTLFGWLRTDMGFKGLANPMALDARHFEALGKAIRKKREAAAFGASQAAAYATYARHLARWIGKPEFVTVFGKALGRDVCKRVLVAQTDKSWEAHGVDPKAKILEVTGYLRWVGLVLAAQHAFGLRKMEALQLKPLRDIKPARTSDAAGKTLIDWSMAYVHIVDGSKGGRPRLIAVSDEIGLITARLLREEMEYLGDREHLPPPQFTLKQNQFKYEWVLKRFGITHMQLGITGHGLRAGFAMNKLEAAGITPTVRGGDGQHADPDHQQVIYKQVTEAMGHGRISVVGAYAGAISPYQAARKKKAADKAAALKASRLDEIHALELQDRMHSPSALHLDSSLSQPFTSGASS